MTNSDVQRPLEEEEWGILASDIKAGHYAFFVASGLSSEAGLPMGAELARSMIKQLYPSSPEPISSFRRRFNYDGELDLPVITQLIQDRLSRAKLIRYLVNCTNWNVQPHITHQFLKLLALETGQRGKALRIVTTNFDSLLELALPSGREVIVMPEDYRQVREDQPWVLKIHGCIKKQPATTIRITTADLARRLRPWKKDAVKDCLHRRGLIVIGYGATDIHVKKIVLSAIQQADREAYWVSPREPDQQVINALSAKNGKLLSMNAMAFFKNLGMEENN
jgi:hypothetical protein